MLDLKRFVITLFLRLQTAMKRHMILVSELNRVAPLKHNLKLQHLPEVNNPNLRAIAQAFILFNLRRLQYFGNTIFHVLYYGIY